MLKCTASSSLLSIVLSGASFEQEIELQSRLKWLPSAIWLSDVVDHSGAGLVLFKR